MRLTEKICFRLPGFKPFLFAAIFLLANHTGVAQHATRILDTCKIVTASLERNNKQQYLSKQSNVIFPSILKGNEEESMTYIQNFSSKRKEYLVRMYKRGKILLPKTVAIFKKYDLPEELKVLLPLESAYNPNAVSKAGAIGYWQIMDEVAKEYGMQYVSQERVSEKRLHKSKGKSSKKIKIRATQKDDRKHFIKSTTIAARYLKCRRFNLNNNWLLVVASYNCGVGNVWSAMERSRKDNPSFWDIKKYLPAETRAYVMNFITMNVIFSNYENFVKNRLIFKPVKMLLPGKLEKSIPAEAETIRTDFN